MHPVWNVLAQREQLMLVFELWQFQQYLSFFAYKEIFFRRSPIVFDHIFFIIIEVQYKNSEYLHRILDPSFGQFFFKKTYEIHSYSLQ